MLGFKRLTRVKDGDDKYENVDMDELTYKKRISFRMIVGVTMMRMLR